MVLGFLLNAAIRYPTDQATAWYTGIGVVVAIAALIAAGLAALFTYPAYHDWLQAQARRPDIEIRFEAGDDVNRMEPLAGRQPHSVPLGAWYLRVTVENNGDKAVGTPGVLWLAVPYTECHITPMDIGYGLFHYAVQGSYEDKYIVPGKRTKVRATEARDDFPPGIRMFNLQCSNAVSRPFPLMARVEGSGLKEPVVVRTLLVGKQP